MSKQIEVVIQGKYIIHYSKTLKMDEVQIKELVELIKISGDAFDQLRDYLGPEDVIDEEPCDELDWTLEVDGKDLLGEE